MAKQVESIVVSGNIGDFTQGQVLQRHQIASYMRRMVNEGADNPTSMTDDELLAVVDAAPPCNDDPADDEIGWITTIESGAPVSA